MNRWWKIIRKSVKWLAISCVTLFLLISLLLYIFKNDIIRYAVKQMDKHLMTRVDVRSIDITFWATFPSVSLDLNQVKVREAYFNARNSDTLLYTDLIRLKFNPLDIWNENYVVKSVFIGEGTLKLRINEAGKENYSIFRTSDSKEETKYNLNVKSIGIEKMRFSYRNQVENQAYVATIHESKLRGNFSDEAFTVDSESTLLAKEIRNGEVPFVVNQEVKSKLKIIINTKESIIQIPESEITLAELPFQFSMEKNKRFLRLKLNAKNLPLQEVANKLTVKEVKTVERFKGAGLAAFSFGLWHDYLNKKNDSIRCNFSVKNGSLTEPSLGVSLNNIQVAGKLEDINGNGKEALLLSKISFSSVHGNFSGNFGLNNFELPQIFGKANGKVDLAMLHALFRFPKIQEVKGKLGINTDFRFKTTEENNTKITQLEHAEGNAELDAVQFQLEEDSRIFSAINGSVGINNHEAVAHELSIHLGTSDLKLNGSVTNVDGFLQNNSSLKVDVITESSRIDLDDFTNKSTVQTASLATIDWMMPDLIRGAVNVDVKDLILQKHHFRNILGDLQMGERSILFNSIQGENGEANISGKLNVIETKPAYFMVSTQLFSKNIAFIPLFKEWNNFDQNVITAENISGKAEVKLQFQAPFDFRTGIVNDEILAEIQLKIHDGKLKNVESFKLLTADLKTPKTRLVLKSNEIDALTSKLNNLSFKTLENTIYLRKGKLIIPKMLIESNAIGLIMEGTHSFTNQIDYLFQFRLRELKEVKDESEFGVVEDDGTGVSVYVRMFGDLNHPTIEWNGKGRKEQAKENRNNAKEEAFSILKSEFGLFKKDSTVKAYKPKEKTREILELNFDEPSEEIDAEKIKAEKVKKKTKISILNEKLKKQGKEIKTTEFEKDL